MEVTWSELKQFLDARSLTCQWVQISNRYWIKGFDGPFSLSCNILLTDPPSDDQVDFETNYKDKGNISPISNVRTQFEQVQYLLQMSNISSLNIAPGDLATVSMKIPGDFNGVTPPANGRYIDAGDAWFYPGADGDKVTSIVLIDKDNLLGMGENFILGTYHDNETPEENQGWALHPVFPTEVSTLGWYGFIPSGIYIDITVKRSSTASNSGNFYCNLKWGMKT